MKGGGVRVRPDVLYPYAKKKGHFRFGFRQNGSTRTRDWTILRVPDVSAAARELDVSIKRGEELYGACIPALRLILVDEAMDERTELEILIHEMLHKNDIEIPEPRIRREAREIAAVLLARGFHIDCIDCRHCGRSR